MNNTTIVTVVLLVLMTLFVGSGVARMAANCVDRIENRNSQLDDVLAELKG
jgi:hypothetical protein